MSSFNSQQDINANCFLCGRPNGRISGDFSFAGNFYRCCSCGDYAIDRRTRINYERYPHERESASHLAAERCVHHKSGFVLGQTDDATLDYQGEQWPYFTMETFLEKYPKDQLEVLDRTLLNLAQLENFPGNSVEFRKADKPEGWVGQPIAFTNNWDKQVGVFLLLEAEGLISIQQDYTSSKSGEIATDVNREWLLRRTDFIRVRILPKGLRRIRELKSGNHQSGATDTMSSPLNITATNSNIQIAGHNAQQTITVTNNVNDAIAELHKILEEKALTDEQTEKIADALDVIANAVEKEKTPTLLERIHKKISLLSETFGYSQDIATRALPLIKIITGYFHE